MDSKTRIVVLGGGYAGIEACKHLEKRYRHDTEVEITLIDRNPFHTLMTELHEVAGSRTEPEAVQVSFKRIFSGRKIRVVTDEIQGVDFDAKVLKSGSTEYAYDYLVISTGGQPEFFGTPGVQENSFTLWSLKDALRIREHFENCFRNAVKEHDPAERARLLTFAVAGAGFTGIELAGELLEHARTLCRTYHVSREDVRIIIIEAKDTILPILAKKPQEAARRYLERKGAEILINSPITKAEEGKVFLADGGVIETRTFVWTCGIHASEFTARLDLTKGKISNDTCSVASPEGIHGMAGCHFDDDDRYIVGKRGRVLVNQYMQSVDHPQVYLCGDMIWFVQQEKVLPQIVETALQTGTVCAENVIASIDQTEPRPLNAAYHGFLVSMGGKYAVAHVMGISLYGIFAMATKHLVNLHYLWGIGGVNVCWGYLQEEFFRIKNRRTFIGGHAAAKIPAYWALPARLWLGLMWVVEGVNKIGEGWFDFAQGSKSGWMFSKGVKQAGLEALNQASSLGNAAKGAADVVAAASDAAGPAVQAAGDAVAAATAAGGPDGAAAVVSQAANLPAAWGWNLDASVLPRDFILVTWFSQTFMDGLFAYLNYQFFQVMIVSTEIAIGLAILGGLFTLPAAAASIGLCIVFTLSGLFSWSQLWFVFLALVMFGGAGQVAGLDYWVLPWMRDRWTRIGFVQRHHLYADEPWDRPAKKQKRKA